MAFRKTKKKATGKKGAAKGKKGPAEAPPSSLKSASQSDLKLTLKIKIKVMKAAELQENDDGQAGPSVQPEELLAVTIEPEKVPKKKTTKRGRNNQVAGRSRKRAKNNDDEEYKDEQDEEGSNNEDEVNRTEVGAELPNLGDNIGDVQGPNQDITALGKEAVPRKFRIIDKGKEKGKQVAIDATNEDSGAEGDDGDRNRSKDKTSGQNGQQQMSEPSKVTQAFIDKIRSYRFEGQGPIVFSGVSSGTNTSFMTQTWKQPWLIEDPEFEGIKFKTAEHYMQWRKARLFGDEETAATIVKDATTAQEAMKLGKGLADYDERIWELYVTGIMKKGNWLKFTHPDALGTIRKALLRTGDRELIFAVGDAIVGIGRTQKHVKEMLSKDDHDREGWGKNHLGRVLQDIRAKFKRDLVAMKGEADI
ncbi:hypothetical protein F4680DRAFT_469120 [Xylaria scruposa]|nr:hypothetical protein F4680DRAFT_469120 [Xylaria scruposa]